MIDAAPWYRSHVFVSMLVAFVSQGVVLFNLKVSPGTISAGVEFFLQAVAIASTAYAGWKRAKSTVQPLTVTQSGADTKNLPNVDSTKTL